MCSKRDETNTRTRTRPDPSCKAQARLGLDRRVASVLLYALAGKIRARARVCFPAPHVLSARPTISGFPQLREAGAYKGKPRRSLRTPTPQGLLCECPAMQTSSQAVS